MIVHQKELNMEIRPRIDSCAACKSTGIEIKFAPSIVGTKVMLQCIDCKNTGRIHAYGESSQKSRTIAIDRAIASWNDDNKCIALGTQKPYIRTPSSIFFNVTATISLLAIVFGMAFTLSYFVF
jgi:hypothetical protein